MLHTCVPTPWEVDAGGPEDQLHPHYRVSLSPACTSWDFILKQQNQNETENKSHCRTRRLRKQTFALVLRTVAGRVILFGHFWAHAPVVSWNQDVGVLMLRELSGRGRVAPAELLSSLCLLPCPLGRFAPLPGLWLDSRWQVGAQAS